MNRLGTPKTDGSRRAVEQLSFRYCDATPAERAQIDNLLLTIDANGDGDYSQEEVRAVAINLLASRRKVRNLKRALCASVFAVLVACGVMLAINIVGNEATKETRSVDGRLTDTNGVDVETATAMYETPLNEFDPSYDLINLETMVVTDAAGVEYSLNVEGHAMNPSTGEFVVYLVRGFTVLIDPGKLDPEEGATMTLLSPDGSSFVYMSTEAPLAHLIPAPGRRLQFTRGGRSAGTNSGSRPCTGTRGRPTPNTGGFGGQRGGGQRGGGQRGGGQRGGGQQRGGPPSPPGGVCRPPLNANNRRHQTNWGRRGGNRGFFGGQNFGNGGNFGGGNNRPGFGGFRGIPRGGSFGGRRNSTRSGPPNFGGN